MRGAPSGEIKMAVHVRIRRTTYSRLLELSLARRGAQEVVVV